MDDVKPEKPGRKGRRGDGAMRAFQEKGTGMLLGSQPLMAEDLVAAWSIPSSEVDTISVLILRQVIGTQKREVIDQIPLRQYDLRSMAGDMGPGTYFVKGTAGPHERKMATIHVSDHMAKQAGFGRMPPPPPAADVVAVRNLNTVATTAGIAPEDLMATIERAAERVMENRIQPQRTASDPMDAMKMFGAMMEFTKNIRADAMEQIKLEMGMKPAEESREDSLMGTVNTVGQLILEFMRGRQNPGVYQQPQPAAHPVMPQQPVETVSQPSEVPMIQPQIIASLTDEERRLYVPAAAMLQRFKSPLLTLAAREPMTDRARADELCAFIPDVYADTMLGYCGLVESKGLPALELIGPEFVTEQWANIVRELKKTLQEKYQM